MKQILLVTGASSDMGQALIRHTNQGYDCVIAQYRTMNPGLAALQTDLGERMICLQADLAQEEEVRHFIGELKDRELSPMHMVHFPAPLCTDQKFHKIRWQVFEKELDVSVKSLILILQAILPDMMKAHYGRIVLMLSFVVNGMPPKYRSNYIMTKYALLGLMKALAVEYADKGITVNGISPSMVMTKYICNMHEYLIEQNAKQSPLGRNLTAEDVIPSIAYLLSDAAACINGQNLSVTCGR